MKKAVVYLRVTKREVENRNDTLVVQKEQIEKYCLENGIEILWEYIDLDFVDEKQSNFQELSKALSLFFDCAFFKKPIDFLVIESEYILGSYIASTLRAELDFYCSELLIINER